MEFVMYGVETARNHVSRLASREDGQDMIEYALLAALIAIAAIVIIILVGPQIRLVFQDVINGLKST